MVPGLEDVTTSEYDCDVPPSSIFTLINNQYKSKVGATKALFKVTSGSIASQGIWVLIFFLQAVQGILSGDIWLNFKSDNPKSVDDTPALVGSVVGVMNRLELNFVTIFNDAATFLQSALALSPLSSNVSIGCPGKTEPESYYGATGAFSLQPVDRPGEEAQDLKVRIHSE